ncbi:hypothetical protein AB0D62_04380 [Streptomyces massasporeus]|uniref:hypothetical protein n=1 Tax=Streptomyces massasporeus TaxID=67324 RepID=UPI0033F02694
MRLDSPPRSLGEGPGQGRIRTSRVRHRQQLVLRRLQVLQLPLEKQAVYAETFRRLRTFEELLTAAGGSGKELVSDMSDRLAAGGLSA